MKQTWPNIESVIEKFVDTLRSGSNFVILSNISNDVNVSKEEAYSGIGAVNISQTAKYLILERPNAVQNLMSV